MLFRSIKDIRDKQINIQTSIKLSATKIKMFETTCSGCSKIKELLKTENVEQLQTDYKQIDKEILYNRDLIIEKEEKFDKLNEILANEKFIEGNIERNNRRIDEINSSVNVEISKEIDIDESKLKRHRKNLSELQQRYNEVGIQRKHYLILKGLFADDGIKAFVIKKYLPLINRLLNTYLAKFESDIIFNFDSEFNEIVLSRHKEDFTYHSFSEGQKKRIDLAVLFTFINFATYKNQKSNSNLLILDEITSGLDPHGKNCLFTVLKEYRDNMKKCIITIDHSVELDPDDIDQIFEVTSSKGFSNINKVEL